MHRTVASNDDTQDPRRRLLAAVVSLPIRSALRSPTINQHKKKTLFIVAQKLSVSTDFGEFFKFSTSYRKIESQDSITIS